MGTMSQKKHNIGRSVTKATVAENLRLPTILPSKPRDPRSLNKPVMTATPPTAVTPGETRRKRRATSAQTTPACRGGANHYITEYRESLMLPPLNDKSRSSVNTVIYDDNVFLKFPKIRAAKGQSFDHQDNRTYLKPVNHHDNNNTYQISTHLHHSNSTKSAHYQNNNAGIQSTHYHGNNAYLESAHHRSNSSLVPSIHDSNTKGTLSLNLKFRPFHSLRSASENDIDAGDTMCSACSPLADSNRKTLYLVMKKYDSEPEFRVWPPEGDEERQRMSSVDFLCDESESDEEGVSLSVDIDWEDIDFASTPSLSPNLV